MSRSSIVITAIAIAMITVLTALVASEVSQYNSNIIVKNGVGYVQTVNGVESLDHVYENDIPIVYVKATGYNALPSSLPNTSAPHGTHTCNMGSYTVTTDQVCSDLK